jgi:GH25 family lysozyme M1 (1,4-beta-N-acetylmuramidase)
MNKREKRLLPLLKKIVVGTTVISGAFAVTAQADLEKLLNYYQVGDHAMGSQIRLHEKSEPLTLTPPGATTQATTSTVPGMDVSNYQGSVNWSTAYANGARFAYVKATENINYVSPSFAQQYNGSYNVGMIRGAYHFAIPSASSGTTQANYFVDHGGGWSADGKTLPGALDIEYNPYGASCYGLTQTAMVNWINDFGNRYFQRTGRYPVIYTSTSWWTTCTGNKGNFSSTSPLWVARYSTSVGTLPYPWGVYTFWQFSDSGIFPGDQDRFNGAYTRLQTLARGS